MLRISNDDKFLQVSDLEEERRKLRLEVKFRAKYHGRAALEMGLSPEQLLLLEEYVEGLKGGRQPEERLVTQLQQRVSLKPQHRPSLSNGHL
jgi:centrosomal protein CEP290